MEHDHLVSVGPHVLLLQHRFGQVVMAPAPPHDKLRRHAPGLTVTVRTPTFGTVTGLAGGEPAVRELVGLLSSSLMRQDGKHPIFIAANIDTFQPQAVYYVGARGQLVPFPR